MKLSALQGHGAVRVVAFSPCGRFLFVSTDRHGWVFDWPSGRRLQDVKIAPLYDAVFKADGMLALCGARTVTMVGLPHLERRPSAKNVAPAGVPSAVWLYADRLITGGFGASRVLLLDFMGNRMASLATPGKHVWSVATHDQYVAAYADQLVIWNEATLEPVGVASGHADRRDVPADMRFFPNGKRVPTNAPAVFAMAFSPSGTTLVTGGSDGRLILWDPEGPAIRAVVDVPDLTPRTLRMFDEAHAYFTAHTGLYRLDLEDRSVHRIAPLQRRFFQWHTPIGLACAPDGRTLAFGGLSERLGRYDLVEHRLIEA